MREKGGEGEGETELRKKNESVTKKKKRKRKKMITYKASFYLFFPFMARLIIRRLIRF